MATICIHPDLIEKVKKIVSEPSSISREKQLTDLYAGNRAIAKELNLAYEKALLLKNQDTALDKFLSNFTEIGQEAKMAMKEKIAQRLAERTDRIQEEELLSIAQDIWSKKYKVDIPLETVQGINKLKIESDALKAKMAGTVDGSEEKIQYGLKQVELKKVISDLKSPTDSMGIVDTIRTIGKNTTEKFTKEKGLTGNIGEAGQLVWDTATSAIYKSVQASMDMSYALRQGFKVLTTNPKVWKENWTQAFEAFKNIGNKERMQTISDLWQARLVSSDLYQEAIDSKLAIGVIEDFFPSTLAEKIPGLGNIFKASNEAFTIFSQGSRMGLFKEMYTKHLDEMTPELAKDLAQVANSITGRGGLGKLERNSEFINKIFYSGRYIRSNLDTFIMPFNTSLSKEARAEAMRVSVRNLGTMAALMGTASTFTDVEWNPLSSRFGKFKLPGSDKWIDLTAGLGSYITLATREALNKTKDKKTGKIKTLGDPKQYKADDRLDIAINFITSKFAPAPSTVAQVLRGSDYEGNKPTLGSVSKNLAVPITVNNIAKTFIENKDEDWAKIVSSITEILGLSSSK